MGKTGKIDKIESKFDLEKTVSNFGFYDSYPFGSYNYNFSKIKLEYGNIYPSKYITKIKEKPAVYTPPAEPSSDPIKFAESKSSSLWAEQKAEQTLLNKSKQNAEQKAAEEEMEAAEEEPEPAEEERERRDIESIASRDGPWRMPLGNVGYIDVDLSKSPPLLVDFHSQFSAFETLVRENYTALECIMSMRAALNTGEGNLLDSCTGAINAVRKMAWCYVAIANVHNNENFYPGLQPYVAKIGKAALDAVKQADAALRCGYPEIAARYSETLFERVEKLSEHLRGANAAQHSVATCKSLHDLVRIFHQAGSVGLFQFMQSPHALNFHNASFVIGDIGGATVSHYTNQRKLVSKPVSALREFYQQSRCQQKRGVETYRIIANANRARIQCALGCHNAEIDAQINGAESFIYFRFFDTDAKQYPNAPYRTSYVRKVLGRLGFQVGGSDKLTEALMSNKPENETYKGLTELAALIASTKDLDVSGSPLESRLSVRKAVSAFFKGYVNMFEADLG